MFIQSISEKHTKTLGPCNPYLITSKFSQQQTVYKSYDSVSKNHILFIKLK